MMQDQKIENKIKLISIFLNFLAKNGIYYTRQNLIFKNSIIQIKITSILGGVFTYLHWLLYINILIQIKNVKNV
jgi:hypothetical protein